MVGFIRRRGHIRCDPMSQSRIGIRSRPDYRFIEVASTAYGTHMPRSDWHVVKNYEVSLPPLEEQTAIAEILDEMDAEIDALETKLARARHIKQGMMQELLTGRIRLV